MHDALLMDDGDCMADMLLQHFLPLQMRLFRHAVLCCAVLCCAVLCCAVLCCAVPFVLCYAVPSVLCCVNI